MKFFVLIVCIALAAIGCKKNKPATVTEIPKAFQSKEANAKLAPPSQKKKETAKTPKAAAPANQPIITPDDAPLGTVVLVNGNARFAVVNFSFGTIPPVGRRVFAYRDGLKVAELKVTGPQREDNTVADILTGSVQVKDEVKGE